MTTRKDEETYAMEQENVELKITYYDIININSVVRRLVEQKEQQEKYQNYFDIKIAKTLFIKIESKFNEIFKKVNFEKCNDLYFDFTVKANELFIMYVLILEDFYLEIKGTYCYERDNDLGIKLTKEMLEKEYFKTLDRVTLEVEQQFID